MADLRDLHIKTPRFIDHHLADERTSKELNLAKRIIKKIVGSFVDQEKWRKVIINLENTLHIEKSFIKILACFAKYNSNLIIYKPNQSLYQKLINNKFPQANIQGHREKPVLALQPNSS